MRHPLAGVSLALLAVLSGGWLLHFYLGEEPPQQTVLADLGGPIEQIVISASSARSSTLRNVELINEIVNRLPPRIKILILAADRDAFTLVSNPWRDRVSFADMPERYRLTIWPQDPFVVLQGRDGPRLLASPEFARAEDTEMARLVATELALPLQYAELSFEGGNIVSDGDFVFIGANTIRHNALEQQVPETEIARRFERLLGKPVIVVGPLPQPIGHIDMMLTPLGDKRLLLADPAWGARLAQQDLTDNPAAVTAFEQRSMQDFFGHSAIGEVHLLDGSVLQPPAIMDTTPLAFSDSNGIAAAIDGLAESLERLGFEIERVPYLEPRAAPAESLARGESIPGQPGYPQITYNNVLIENLENSARVYLPEYGWPALDRAAAKTWQDLGYEVVGVPGFTTSAMYGGALRCSVKVLARR